MPTGSDPRAASKAVRPVRATVTASSGYGDVGEDGCDDGVGGDTLHLRLGPQADAMAKRGECQGFYVIRNDVVAPGEPGPGTGGGQQGGGASGRDAKGERGDSRVARQISTT